MFKTFKQSYQLHTTLMVNRIIFSLKQIPILKNFLPTALYQSATLKSFGLILTVIWEFIKVFVFKPLYIFLMIYLPSVYFQKNDISTFLHIFVFMTAAGTILNSNFIKAGRNKYYGITLLHMPPEEYILANYLYELAKGFLGILVGCLLFGSLSDIRFFYLFWMPVFYLASRITITSIRIWLYEKLQFSFKEPPTTPTLIILAALFVVAAYVLPFLDFVLGGITYIFLVLFTLACCIPALRYLMKKPNYKALYLLVLRKEKPLENASKTIHQTHVNSLKEQMDMKLSIDETKKGYAYLHDIFVKRHRKLLINSAIIVTGILLLIFVLLFIILLVSPKSRSYLNVLPLKYLTFIPFVMYLINRGQTISEVMFINCDNSMLTYRCYRSGTSILEVFRYRLKTLILINLLPASVIAIGLPLLLLFSGGTDQPLNYLILVVSILSMSVFFSVHYLVLYYLIQPFTSTGEAKSALYRVILTITYIVVYSFSRIAIPTLYFGLAVLAFTGIYIGVSLLLVSRFAPKTFHLR